MITLNEKADGFELTFKNRIFITHSSKKPFVTLAVGEADYAMYSGHFRIKKKIKSKIKPKSYSVLSIDPNQVSIKFDDAITVNFAVVDNRLNLTFDNYDKEINRIFLKLEGDKDEHIYGCGEQFTYLNMKGLKVPIFVEEQGVGRGKDLITFLANMKYHAGGAWYTTYLPLPTFVSSKSYFCHVDTGYYSVLDFSKKTEHTLEMWEVPERIVLDTDENILNLFDSITGITGKQPPMPDWIYDGVWLGVQGGPESVSKKLDDARNHDIKVGALWAQDWEGKRVTFFGQQLMWNWKYDNKRYPDLPSFIKKLNSEGIKFLGYINPCLAVGRTEDKYGPIPDDFLYKEAKEKGYCVKDKDGNDYLIQPTAFWVGTIDLTNPEAYNWIKEIIKKNLIGIGLHGWMCDYGEYLPTDAVMHSGESAEKIHNTFPVLWAKVNREAIEEAGRMEDITFFMRAGFIGSAKYSLSHWAGDQLVNWSLDDGFGTIIPAAISLGFCGIGMIHSDIGGFTTVAWIKRTKELFMRWAEQAPFMPLMRTHEGSRPDDNWQFNSDDETMDHFSQMTKVYCELKPYHKKLVAEYNEKGIPQVRHPFIHYPEDKTLHKLRYQYMYGSDLLVAPVIKKGRKKWKVYLPKDKWVHLWTDKKFTGGWITVDAPIGSPPVFYRDGSEFEELFKKLKDI